MTLERESTSHVLKNDPRKTWQPSASIKNLQKRAEIVSLIRAFFAARNIMEVETPMLGYTSVTDPFIESIPAYCKSSNESDQACHYLQTSPEYAMKRLLAAGSGPIYQIAKAFRQDEIGRFHNPEFTLLEWYRTDFNHHALMDETDALLQTVLGCPKANRWCYRDIFTNFLDIDPIVASVSELKQCAAARGIVLQSDEDDKDTWLNLLMTHCLEPILGKDCPDFIYDFPASQAALARLSPHDPNVASRFEVYIAGVELANGFHELQDAAEQRARFEKNLADRKKLARKPLPIDEYFMAALHHGLPNCAGVALGLDRLIMLATNSKHIGDVISFDFTRI